VDFHSSPILLLLSYFTAPVFCGSCMLTHQQRMETLSWTCYRTARRPRLVKQYCVCWTTHTKKKKKKKTALLMQQRHRHRFSEKLRLRKSSEPRTTDFTFRAKLLQAQSPSFHASSVCPTTVTWISQRYRSVALCTSSVCW